MFREGAPVSVFSARYSLVLAAIVTRVLLLDGVTPTFAQPPLASEPYAVGLSQPVGFVQDPGLPNVQYVVQQNGLIRVIQNGVQLSQNFLDLSDVVNNNGEQGLLGLALPPDYAVNGRSYVHFNRRTDGAHVVARFTRSQENPLQAEKGTRFDLLWPAMSDIHSRCVQPEQRVICQPFSNHNGGKIAFGPDGFLYIGLGDGGDGNDPEHMAQRPRTLHGKMVRIDVTVPLTDMRGYRIPATNPFVGNDPLGALDEIWAFGLRNPWQFSFDNPALGGTGALIIGDVGQGTREEIDYEPANSGGRNYGWRNKEGVLDHIANPPPAFVPLSDPLFDYAHGAGASVTAGYVYRGTGLGSFYRGRYFFADFVKGQIWSLGLTVLGNGEAVANDIVEHTAGIGAGAISAFGTDSNGELYVVYYSPGRIVRIKDVVALTAFNANVPFPAPAGRTITWTAQAVGANLEYQFIRLDTGAWTIVQPYGPSPSYTWVPAASDTGTHALQVWVRKAGFLAVPYQDWRGTGIFTIGPPLPLVVTSLVSAPGLPVPAGTPVVWSASTSGGIGPIEYLFWVFNGTINQWTLGRSYSTQSSFTWTPSAAGIFALQVWVRSAGSAASYEAWAGSGYVTVTSGPPALLTAFSANKIAPFAANSPVVWTAVGSSQSGPVEYQFILFNASTGWVIQQGYLPSNVWTWTPTAPGTYAVQVWIRVQGASQPFHDWRGSGFFTVQ